ncbi:hypothetical protein FHR99_000726 [Litorivivens lipolytica]|uniref:Uncharacterized protein n=1 Tax=Litorivivens lipolytica TaxID=1524264 RepID=A0A7W4Z624_9GAMM|nr:hypothetical protein [Litorivivens lipolytica]MBB3046490.1 hypothetical protein [Litorivivens lipolytica]
MAASVRAHANLQLFLARKCIERLEQPADPFWGEHAETVDRDHAVFHLQLAYRGHLADLCEQRQRTLRPVTAAQAVAMLQGEPIPEIAELAEKEELQDWLKALVSENFLPGVETASLVNNSDLIPVSSPNALSGARALSQIADELASLFARHRDTQQEY